MRGGDSARRVLDLRSLGITGLVAPFSEEIHFGERVGMIGPNGSGKSELMRTLAGVREPDSGELVVGPRVSRGFFTQLQSRDDLSGEVIIDVVLGRVSGGGVQAAMGALARYGLAEAARRSYDVLSGGEKARLEVLVLELEGHNLLLLDEPTDNLDLASAEALQEGLESYAGTVLAATHDRWFARSFDRFLVFGADGAVYESADPVWDESRVARPR
jgi:ATPase subunit of ABC transporter with duplicated ATPase domains